MNIFSKKHQFQNTRSQKGSLTMFIAFVILPILFFLFTLSLDLSMYYTSAQRAQKVVDDAVLYAHRFLPSQTSAEQAANLYIQQNTPNFDLQKSSATVTAGNDFIEVNFQNSITLTFASLLGIGDGNLALPYSVTALARSTPLDIFMAIDTSSYLAPNPLGSADKAWGESNYWPEAYYFEHERKVFRVEEGSTSSNGQVLAARLATQQCFNPVFSELKRAAIQIYDYLGNFDLNYIGLGFYPFTGADLDIARMPLKPGERNPKPENVSDNIGEADFNTVNGSIFVNNSLCAAAAETETNRTSGHDGYKFPQRSLNIRQTISNNYACSQSITDPISGNFNADFQQCLHARDVIWSQAVSPTSEQHFPNTLRTLNSELIWAISQDKERGGLIDSVSKVGIVLAGDVPRIGNKRFPLTEDIINQEVKSELSDSLNATVKLISDNGQQRKINYTLLYVIFAHQGINDSKWDQRITELQKYLYEFNNTTLPNGSSFKIRLFVADSPQRLVNELLSLVLMQKRSVMIAR